ncbi:TPA: transcription elongation factor GreA [Candidatus Gracilibacteria bacterium]|nr:transcription elongation factor GreA [Candidatus Peregrinibacteria bacterium]HIQ56490.1 transcription elongation factor GreA [Candidatus Gracilibacteria bacterium]HIQ57386.1 transcription elongation factor GreA [Candidatus Gracilibacteria bacterium]
MSQIIVTAEGYKKMQDEIEHLKTTRRQEVADRLKDAISYGDLSENSEYQEAKEEQAFLEGKITSLSKEIQRAVIEKTTGTKESIHLGSKIKLKIDNDPTEEYEIVGAREADPFANKISNESPVGKGLLGRKKGEIFSIDAPVGTVKYEIVNILK